MNPLEEQLKAVQTAASQIAPIDRIGHVHVMIDPARNELRYVAMPPDMPLEAVVNILKQAHMAAHRDLVAARASGLVAVPANVLGTDGRIVGQ